MPWCSTIPISACEECVLTAQQVNVIQLYFIAIAAQCNGLVITGIHAVAQGILDGQVLELQAIIL